MDISTTVEILNVPETIIYQPITGLKSTTVEILNVPETQKGNLFPFFRRSTTVEILNVPETFCAGYYQCNLQQ